MDEAKQTGYSCSCQLVDWLSRLFVRSFVRSLVRKLLVTEMVVSLTAVPGFPHLSWLPCARRYWSDRAFRSSCQFREEPASGAVAGNKPHQVGTRCGRTNKRRRHQHQSATHPQKKTSPVSKSAKSEKTSLESVFFGSEKNCWVSENDFPRLPDFLFVSSSKSLS